MPKRKAPTSVGAFLVPNDFGIEVAGELEQVLLQDKLHALQRFGVLRCYRHGEGGLGWNHVGYRGLNGEVPANRADFSDVDLVTQVRSELLAVSGWAFDGDYCG